MNQADPFHWTVVVRDAMGRDRTVRIAIRGGRIAVVVPPGEGFSMSLHQCEVLAASLYAACDQARRQS